MLYTAYMIISPALLGTLGLNAKAKPLYEAALVLGEATIQDLANQSGIKRTTIYYILPSLLEAGVLIEIRKNKKSYYRPESPETVTKRAQEKLIYTEAIPSKAFHKSHKTHIYFLYGPSGFKQIWDKVFASKSREFRIITQGKSFLDFTKEPYILNEIIEKKRKKGISSRQIIVDSPYARSIVEKDAKENRASRFLPRHTELPFTQIISDTFVAFISPRMENMLFIIESEGFAVSSRSLFEEMWKKL